MRNTAAFLLLVGSCGASADPRSGVTALMRISGAQIMAGEISSEGGGPTPELRSVSTNNSRLYRGVQNKSVSGASGPGSVAIMMGMKGDRAHWVFPVDDRDLTNPGDFLFSARIAFSPAVAPGEVGLILRAVDRQGHLGPARSQTMVMESGDVAGPLVMTLTWDSEADLDLRVVAPSSDGTPAEIWSRKRNGLAPTPPGEPSPSDEAIAATPYLDFDSNSQCVIDGSRQESIVWPVAPPAGRYSVRVDAFSLCGEVAARWRLQVTSNGTVIHEARGQMADGDTRFDHGAGAGLQVLTFDL